MSIAEFGCSQKDLRCLNPLLQLNHTGVTTEQAGRYAQTRHSG
jgi:hypothetical protein